MCMSRSKVWNEGDKKFMVAWWGDAWYFDSVLGTGAEVDPAESSAKDYLVLQLSKHSKIIQSSSTNTMATARRCFAQLSLSCSRPTLPPTIFQPARFLSVTAPLGKKDKGKKKVPVQKYKKKGTEVKKKKPRTVFKTPDLSSVETFALCDAMRYVGKLSRFGYLD